MPDYDDIDTYVENKEDYYGWLFKGIWKALIDIEEVLEEIRDNQGPPGHRP